MSTVRLKCTSCRSQEPHVPILQAKGARCHNCRLWHVFRDGVYVAAPEQDPDLKPAAPAPAPREPTCAELDATHITFDSEREP